MIKWNPYRVLCWLVLCSSFSFFSGSSFAAVFSSNCSVPAVPSCNGVAGGLDRDSYTSCLLGTFPGGSWNPVPYTPYDPNPPSYWSFRNSQGADQASIICNSDLPPPDPCEAYAGEVSNSSFGFYYFATSGSDIGPSPVGCFNGCKHRVLNGFQGPMPFGGGFMLVATKVSNMGVSCESGELSVTVIPQSDIPSVPPEDDPDNNNEPEGPSDCPAGTGFAQVNNKNMCLPSGTTGNGPTSTNSSTNTTTTTDPITGETVTTGGPDVTTSTTIDWVINGDGSVTKTTTKTVDYGNGETATTITTTTDGVAGITGGSGGSGSNGSGSGAGGSGDGDINFGAPPVWNDPGNGGDAPDLTIGQLDAIDIHQVFLPEGGECALEDIPLEVMGISISIPLSSACPYFPYVYGLVVFMSALVSIRLFAMAPW